MRGLIKCLIQKIILNSCLYVESYAQVSPHKVVSFQIISINIDILDSLLVVYWKWGLKK